MLNKEFKENINYKTQSNKNNNEFNTNIQIKNTYGENKPGNDNSKNNFEENKKTDNDYIEENSNRENSNIFFIENKNTFSNSNNLNNNNMNEFKLQIQFSNGINKQKILKENLNVNSENNLIANNLENTQNGYIDKEENSSYNEAFLLPKKNENFVYNLNKGKNYDKYKLTENKIIRKIKSNNLFGLNYLEFLLKDKYRFAKNIECNKFNCLLPSICLDESFCKCGEEYANFNEDKNNYKNLDNNNNYESNISNNENYMKEPQIYCNYKRKKQIISFMLEFFLFFGMGHVYSGNYIIGISKFVFFVLLILFKVKNNKSNKEMEIEEDDNQNNKKINWLHLLILLLAVIWYLVDIIFLALSKYIDGNGVPMLSW